MEDRILESLLKMYDPLEEYLMELEHTTQELQDIYGPLCNFKVYEIHDALLKIKEHKQNIIQLIEKEKAK